MRHIASASEGGTLVDGCFCALHVVELICRACALLEFRRINSRPIRCLQLVDGEARPGKLLLQFVLLHRVEFVHTEALGLESILHLRLVIGQSALQL